MHSHTYVNIYLHLYVYTHIYTYTYVYTLFINALYLGLQNKVKLQILPIWGGGDPPKIYTNRRHFSSRFHTY